MIDRCVIKPCGINAICTAIDADTRECSCPDDFPNGDPQYGCFGKHFPA